jgi:tripartite-type tricarboxylate transporter receptor subunit TctC
MKNAFRIAAVLAAAAMTAWQPAQAQYPNAPIRLVVPFPAGGLSEVLAREVGRKMAETLGQPLVVENVPGAGSTIGNTLVARAAPNGYTLLFGYSSGLTIAPGLYKNLAYDPPVSYAPIGGVARFSYFLAAPVSAPFNSLKELIAYARANPGKLSFGTPGIGSTPHLMGEMFNAKANINIVHVPYKGGGQVMIDLLAGRVDLSWDAVSNFQAGLQARKIKPIAVTAPRRSAAYPDIGTVHEDGIPELEVYTWTAILAPAGTPPEIRARLEDALNKALASPDLQQTFTGRGLEVFAIAPQALTQLMRTEIAHWTALINRAGIKPE